VFVLQPLGTPCYLVTLLLPSKSGRGEGYPHILHPVEVVVALACITCSAPG
jgi:hypothetical protein